MRFDGIRVRVDGVFIIFIIFIIFIGFHDLF
jgi:hypothetical protein